MSEKLEQAMAKTVEGRNVTSLVNGLSMDEQLQFARQLWERGSNARTDASDRWVKTTPENIDVTFQNSQNGERQVADIVFPDGQDIYDTAAEVREKTTNKHYTWGAKGSDSSASNAAAANPSNHSETKHSFLECMDSVSSPGAGSKRVDTAVCAAETNFAPDQKQ